MEQVEQIQDEARGGREEELGAKGVFQYVFQMFHFCDDAIAGGAEMLPGSMTMRRREIVGQKVTGVRGAEYSRRKHSEGAEASECRGG